MERLHTRNADTLTRDWEYICAGCGKIAFSMTSAAKALHCRHCQADLIPIWFPIKIPRIAVPAKLAVECPHCWESMVITLPSGKVPFGKTLFTCRHCLEKGAVNFRKHPIVIQKVMTNK